MKSDMFPIDYNKIVDEKTELMLEEAKKKHDSRINSINNSRPQKPQKSAGDSAFLLGVLGGFFACVGVCIYSDTIVLGIVTWVLLAIVCFSIGGAIDKKVNIVLLKDEISADSRICEENEFIEKEIQRIKADAQTEKKQYFDSFESRVQNLSIQFADSEVAKEVIEWMSNGFYKTIDDADRRSHVEKVTVPFVYNVYCSKITCNLGTYDFELKRCKNLCNPLEQTALARAIASAIQLNIIMKYPKDSSGTDISIDISYSYTSEYPSTTITYNAPNGNYKVVRGW